ncbi:aminoglycoside phosphotransferase family protein [Mycetocola zhujimingii]|uniref:aminoglycoside phosphotransferase family protein n=1 Tax=Mycetocola zhujimingii TaxID=2079792 RepID=UPI000D3D7713|nr:aminoglycoside phosphotransferase family protein [Mycetocola zhujimingii]AWB86484.1 phosphotransferase [Mycetocola zhujimingii]
MAMHPDEIPITARLVQQLLADQFPEVAHLPVREFRSTGTVNAVFRIGDGLLARLPRLTRWAADLDREARWLPSLASHVPLSIPVPVFLGKPTGHYRSIWAVYEWIDGSPYTDDAVDDEVAVARALADFLTHLHRIDIADAPGAGRRPLAELDAMTREALTAARDLIDAEKALAAWNKALTAPVWDGTPVWIHTDLLRPNLLVRGGRLAAVIDWGGTGVGDPAADVIAAWSVFGSPGRAAFLAALDVDEQTRDRALGYALHQAAMIIPYYRTSNPAFVSSAVRTVEQVIADTA